MTGKPGETPEATPAGETPEAIPAGETPEPKDDLAGLRDALAKEREARRRFEAEAKKNAGAAQKLAEAEDADKSEIQRAVDRSAAAEARAKLAESRLLRYEVAAAKGISHAMAARLQGETREELEADAEELLKELPAPTAPKPSETPGGRPREALRSGTAPDTQPEDNDPTKLAALIPRG